MSTEIEFLTCGHRTCTPVLSSENLGFLTVEYAAGALVLSHIYHDPPLGNICNWFWKPIPLHQMIF